MERVFSFEIFAVCGTLSTTVGISRPWSVSDALGFFYRLKCVCIKGKKCVCVYQREKVCVHQRGKSAYASKGKKTRLLHDF